MTIEDDPSTTCNSPMSFADLADLCRKLAPDPAADRTVTAEITTIRDLADLLTDQLRKVHALAPDRPMGRQELACTEEVATALGELMPPSAPAGGSGLMPGMGSLIDIPVIVSPGSAPGTWCLVTHDGCEIRDTDGDPLKARVSHERCTVTAEGRIG